MLSGDHKVVGWEQWDGGDEGFIKDEKGRLKRTLATIPKPQSHHAVNTGNMGAKVRKDTLCFKGGGEHCPSLKSLQLRVFFFFSCKMLSILHCLDTVPPLD